MCLYKDTVEIKRIKIMGCPDQRNNFTTINKDTRESPTNALKYVTNRQVKTKHQCL